MIDEASPNPTHTGPQTPRLTRRVSHTLAVLFGIFAGVALVLSVIP